MLQIKIKEDVANELPDVNIQHAASIKKLSLPSRADEPFAELRKKKSIKSFTPLFSSATRGRPLSAAPTSVAAAVIASVRHSENEGLRGINMIQLSKNADIAKIEKDLQANDAIEYVHRIPARWAATNKTPKAVSVDPMINRQWGLRAINWFAQNVSPNAENVSVGVLDTGIDTKHPDLQNFSTYTHDGASAEDIIGHGTHVAGIIGATNNNDVGITGICKCDLHIWKIFGDEPSDDDEYYVDEIMYQRALNGARNNGMRVINLSIGGTVYTQTEALLIKRLIDRGCCVIAAMGNEYLDGNPIEYPAAYPNVIAIGAINETDRRAYFSNTGTHIALVAPGKNIVSTLPVKKSAARDETQYAAWDGTSMATPHVVAAAALVLSKDLSQTPKQVADKLKNTATKVAAMKKKKKTKEYGAGLLNLQAAL
jgi:subtilisin family serine protease